MSVIVYVNIAHADVDVAVDVAVTGYVIVVAGVFDCVGDTRLHTTGAVGAAFSTIFVLGLAASLDADVDVNGSIGGVGVHGNVAVVDVCLSERCCICWCCCGFSFLSRMMLLEYLQLKLELLPLQLSTPMLLFISMDSTSFCMVGCCHCSLSVSA